jgi:TRAP-type C4-dicarboxylate transport system substrate-binding protein
MAYGEVYTALQNKVIDGCEINWPSIYSEKFYEQLDYTSEIGLFPFPGGYFVNLDFWKSLSPEDQAIFEKAAQKGMDENIKIMKDIETKARETSIKSGVAVNEVKDLTPFIEAVKPLYDSYSAKDPLMKNFIEMAKKL